MRILDELTGEEVLIKEVDGEATTYKCDHCPYITTHHDLRGLHMQKEHNLHRSVCKIYILFVDVSA